MLGSSDSGDCLIVARDRWGLFCFCHADCESRRAGLEPLLGICDSVRRNQSRLIQLRQGFVEASDACVVEVSRLMEPHDDGASVVLPRCTRKRIGRSEQRDGGNSDDFDRTRRPPAEPTGWLKLLHWSRIGRAERKHLMISF